MDITKLLRQDHDEVRTMFRELKALTPQAEKTKVELSARIIKALEVHTRIEEELFYPRLEKAKQTEDMVKEAYVEHRQAKSIMSAMKTLTPNDDMFDAKMKVLDEDIEHHASEEENEMFPAAREVLDRVELIEIGLKAIEMKKRLQPEKFVDAKGEETDQPQA